MIEILSPKFCNPPAPNLVRAKARTAQPLFYAWMTLLSFAFRMQYPTTTASKNL